MSKSLEKHKLFRGDVSRGLKSDEQSVDREEGVIRGFSVMTSGEVRNHGVIADQRTLEQVVQQGNQARFGIKSRFGHPTMSGEALGTLLGRAKNFRLDGEQVRADLHLDPSAHSTPNGDLAGYVMGLAETDPESFGTSIVFDPEYEAQLDEKGKPIVDANTGEEALPLVRVKKLFAVDAVDTPAANDALFGTKFFTADVELSAAATRFLESFLGRPEAVEQALGFLQRFRATQEPEKEDPMAEPKKDEAPTIDFEPIRKDGFTAGHAEGKKLGAEEATKLERERIAKIHASSFPGQEELVREAIEKGYSVEEAQARFIDDEKKQGKKRLETFRKDEVPALGPNEDRMTEKAPTSEKVPDGEYDEVALSAQWDKDAGLRSEFLGDKKSFLAYHRAFARGEVKIKSGK
jgi:hypothetical protein